jgi:hypothetical protein
MDGQPRLFAHRALHVPAVVGEGAVDVEQVVDVLLSGPPVDVDEHDLGEVRREIVGL